MNGLLIALSSVLATFMVVLCLVISHLNKRMKEKDAAAKRFASDAEVARAKVEDLQRTIYGERVPGKHCEGCKYLVRYLQPGWPLSDGNTTSYGCRKNIRCGEYEEE